MRRLITIFLLFCLAYTASAQEVADDFRLYKIDERQSVVLSPVIDTALFYRALHTDTDLYEQLTAYRFSFVEYARRGHYYTEREASLDGLTLRPNNVSILRRLALAERGYAGVDYGEHSLSSMAGTDVFSTRESVPVDGGSVAAFFSGKGYLGGVRAVLHSSLGREWTMSLYAAGKGGNDLYVRGVYNNSVDGGVRLSKMFASGGVFSVVALATIGERGLRSTSTEEAFTLVGDNLYNPSWGRQQGRIRNSRLRRDAVPFVMASLQLPLWQSTDMLLSVGGDYGERSYIMPGWWDATTPRPDNYRYMPSYFGDENVATAVADSWRERDERYTQIDWQRMYEQNRMSQRGAVYTLDESVERMARTQLLFRLKSRLSEQVEINYGVRGGYTLSRNFRRIDDLLGAEYLHDVDYYLLDDDTYSNMLQNNLSTPDRRVVKGDKFSYDYTLQELSVMAEMGVRYESSRWQLRADAAIGFAEKLRRGHFEKELFPGNGSYGRSAKVKFSPYTLKAHLSYILSAQHRFSVGVMASSRAPEGEHLFLNPQYNNRLVDAIKPEQHYAADVNYRYSSDFADVAVSAYYHLSLDEREVIRTYDDLSATYCDVDISGLGIARYGVEAAAQIRINESLRATATASAARYVYAKNPVLTHYADTDNHLISSTAVSYMGDCYLGGAPMLTATAELTYLTYSGWIASLGAQMAALRYVDPSPMRRTERVAHQASASQEIFRSFITQRRLPNAVTLDASLSRWFDIGQTRLSLTLSVSNLLGNRNIIYGGYESSRIRNYMSGARRIYSPQDDQLRYAYGRTYYAVVSWKF